MNTNKNIQTPDHQAGRASSRLIFLLAFILAGLTLIAGSSATGEKSKGATKNLSKCGFGKSEPIYDKKDNIVGCQRTVGFWESCGKCISGDTVCDCTAGCKYDVAYQQGVLQTVTKWETNSFKVGLPTEGWEFLKLDLNGARIMVRQTGYTNQCVYP